MYDSRARERRRLIEEQEALAAQLLRQVTANFTFIHHPLSQLLTPDFLLT